MLPTTTLVNKVADLWQMLSLRAKLSVYLVGMTVIPLLLTTAITGYNGEKALIELVIDHNWNAALHTAEDIDRMFGEKIRILRMAAATSEIKSMISEKQLPLLKSIEGQDADILIVTTADADGNLIARSDAQPIERWINYSNNSYFQNAKQAGKTTISDVILSKTTGYPSIVIAQPIQDEQQKIVGILSITVELRTVMEHINRTKIGQTGYIYLVNQDGHILVHPDWKLVASQDDVSQWAPVEAVMEQKTGWTEYEVNRQKKLATYSYIHTTGWGLVVEQPLNEALEYVNHVKRTGIVMSMLAALVASLLSIIIAGMMTKRITNIAAITDHLATGNMNASLKVTSNDEIGQLALAFNKMVVQLKASRTELRDSEEKYRSLVENSNVGVYRKTGNDNSFIEYANPALAKMFGFPSVEELLQASAIQFSDQESFKLLIEEIDQQGAVKEREIRLKKKDGTSVWCSVTSIKHFDEKRQVFLIDSVVKDITERKIAEEALRQVHADLEIKVNERTQELRVLNEKLYRLSLEDGLTGIANRRCFDEFLQREWQRARREQLPLALIMLDVDLFKHYNDTYGHVSGDECLKRVAGVIKEVAKRATDLAARYGGEEFAIVLPNTDQANAVKLGNEILVGVRELGIRNATAVSSQIVTISLGIAVIIPSDITTPESLIIAADQALYQAKKAGRNQLQVASTNT